MARLEKQDVVVNLYPGTKELGGEVWFEGSFIISDNVLIVNMILLNVKLASTDLGFIAQP